MDIVIDKPQSRHVSEIASICAAGWKQTVEGMVSRAFQDKNVAYWYSHDKVQADMEAGHYSHVALIGSQVVGMIGGAMTGPERADIFVLYVDEAYRYQGIGRRLLGAFTQKQIEEGASEQWVSVQKDNWLGIPFYEARGFVFQEEQIKEMAHGEMYVVLKYKRAIG